MAKTKQTKEETLKEAILAFKESKQISDDYFQLFIAFHQSIRPDNGLIWSEVERILKETVDKGERENDQ